MSRVVSAFFPLLLAALLFACGSSKPKPDPEPALESSHRAVNPLEYDDEDDSDGMQVQGMLGTMDEEAIEEGIRPRLEQVTRCFQTELATHPYLGGQVTFKYRVTPEGQTKKVYLSESSLGSYPAERCMVQAVSDLRFERPRGGEAEFTYTLTFQGRTQPPIWDPSIVKDELQEGFEQLLAVPEGSAGGVLVAPPGLVITFYVSHEGKVLCAGLVASEAIDPAFAEPFVQNLKQLKFVEPQTRFAKVTYAW